MESTRNNCKRPKNIISKENETLYLNIKQCRRVKIFNIDDDCENRNISITWDLFNII